MSLVFNDTTTKHGIVQEYEKECGYEYGDVSNDPNKLLALVSGANLAFDDYLSLAFGSDSTWPMDDSNFSDYPIITTDLVAGQRDYPFVTDQTGNLILEIAKVFVKQSAAGAYVEASPVNVSAGSDQPQNLRGAASGLLYYGGLTGFTNGLNVQGTPNRYDKLANGIFLDPIPNANIPGGLKVYINREPSYFTAADTTKKPGVPGLHHRYFVLKPAVDYARRNGTNNYATLKAELEDFEGNEETGVIGKIQRYFARRAKDVLPRMVVGRHDNR